MRCTSSNVLSLLSSSVLSNGVRFSPVSSYLRSQGSRFDSGATMRERGYTDTPNHNPIITLISALSAMGLRDAPNQPSYSTHFVHGTMITVNKRSFVSLRSLSDR